MNPGYARVIFEGQSLNVIPLTPSNMPDLTMQGLSNEYPYWNVAIGGTAWSTLDDTAASRFHQLLNWGPSVIVLTGGTADVSENDTAETLYSDLLIHANNSRVAGADRVIVTTIPKWTMITTDQDNVRIAANTMILNSSDFDAVVDFANLPELDDPSDTTYYFDGIHWTAAAAQAAANALIPVLQQQLDEITSSEP